MAFNDEEKVVDTEKQQEEVVEETTLQEEVVVEEVNTNKKTNKKDKKPSKIKAAFGELKKVSYPSFSSVVKRTAVVLAVTFVFLVVIIGIDQLLYLLYTLLTKR